MAAMKRKPLNAILLISVPTAVVALIAALLLIWRVPTRIEMDLTVERAKLTVDLPESTSTLVLNSIDFQSISVQNFKRITLQPERMEIADPTQYDFAEDHFPESAWKALDLTGSEVEITKRDGTGTPTVTLESAKTVVRTSDPLSPVHVAQGSLVTLEVRGDQNQAITIKLAGETPSAVLSISVKDAKVKALGTLDSIWARGGSDVTLEVTGEQEQAITIQLDGKEPSAVLSAILSVAEPFQLIADNTRLSGIAESLYQEEDSLTYRASLRNDSPFIQFTGAGSLGIKVHILFQKTVKFFSKVAIPVTFLEFIRKDQSGNWVSAVVTDGEIAYPDYPNIDGVSFRAPDFIGLDGLERFRIEKISLDPTRKGMRFRLDGVAGHIMTRSGAFLKDHRLTLFDTLWQNPRLMILFSMIVWVLPTVIGAYQLYNHLRGG